MALMIELLTVTIVINIAGPHLRLGLEMTTSFAIATYACIKQIARDLCAITDTHPYAR